MSLRALILCVFIVSALIPVNVLSMGTFESPDDSGTGISEPAWTDSDIDQVVRKEEVRLLSPHGITIGTPLPESNEIRFLRFYPEGSTPQTADAVVILLPGLLAGSNTFHYLGRQLVYMAHTYNNMSIEVIAMERRTNNLEDLTGLNAAEDTGDIAVAMDYYKNGKIIDGKQFSGFLTSETAPYISEFGLGIIMDDLYTVATHYLPDREDRKRKLFVGGHSLGGFMTAYFAGWDFDGNPETLDDAGFMNCAGLIGLDTMISEFSTLLAPVFGDLKIGKTLLKNITPATYPALVDSVREGILQPILPLDMIGFTAETYMTIELLSMMASWDPDSESRFLSDYTQAETVNKALKFMHSRDLVQFLNPEVTINRYRYTNSALFGIMLDDNFMPFAINHFGMGFLKGGRLAEKTFPLPGTMPESPLTYIIELMMTGENLYIADDFYSLIGSDKAPLYSWAGYDEIVPDPDHPEYPSVIDEVTDLHDAAELTFSGPSNLIDWYFPTRIMVDVFAAGEVVSEEYNLKYMHKNAAASLPEFIRLAEDGTFIGPAIEAGITVTDDQICPEYNHMDVVSAVANRPTYRENLVFMPMIRFMDSVIHQ